jgi:hypothetical protein
MRAQERPRLQIADALAALRQADRHVDASAVELDRGQFGDGAEEMQLLLRTVDANGDPAFSEPIQPNCSHQAHLVVKV